MECRNKKHVWNTSGGVIKSGSDCKCGAFKMPSTPIGYELGHQEGIIATEGSIIENIRINKMIKEINSNA